MNRLLPLTSILFLAACGVATEEGGDPSDTTNSAIVQHGDGGLGLAPGKCITNADCAAGTHCPAQCQPPMGCATRIYSCVADASGGTGGGTATGGAGGGSNNGSGSGTAATGGGTTYPGIVTPDAGASGGSSGSGLPPGVCVNNLDCPSGSVCSAPVCTAPMGCATVLGHCHAPAGGAGGGTATGGTGGGSNTNPGTGGGTNNGGTGGGTSAGGTGGGSNNGGAGGGSQTCAHVCSSLCAMGQTCKADALGCVACR